MNTSIKEKYRTNRSKECTIKSLLCEFEMFKKEKRNDKTHEWRKGKNGTNLQSAVTEYLKNFGHENNIHPCYDKIKKEKTRDFKKNHLQRGAVWLNTSYKARLSLRKSGTRSPKREAVVITIML